MFRFTIRDVLWLTVVVALAVGWALDRGRLASAVADANKRADETELERATWERMMQRGAVAHNKTLGVIEKSGLRINGDGKTTFLERIREPDAGFDIKEQEKLRNGATGFTR